MGFVPFTSKTIYFSKRRPLVGACLGQMMMVKAGSATHVVSMCAWAKFRLLWSLGKNSPPQASRRRRRRRRSQGVARLLPRLRAEAVPAFYVAGGCLAAAELASLQRLAQAGPPRETGGMRKTKERFSVVLKSLVGKAVLNKC